MLFDEWDYRLTFQDRPAGILLPALDRLRSEAFLAHAVRPDYSVPAMLIGRWITDARRPSGPVEYLIKLETQSSATGLHRSDGYVRWGDQPTVFSRLRSAGWTTSLIGHYLPYCRVFGSQIDRCFWEPGASTYDRVEYGRELSSIEVLRTLFERQLSKAPLVNRFYFDRHNAKTRELQIREYLGIRNAGFAAIDTTDFVFVHWPVPHPYGIYNRTHGALDAHTGRTYLDNLVLVDTIVGDLRTLLENRGEWDGATVILSSDHSLRVGQWKAHPSWTAEEAKATGNIASPYVPFIVKLPGQLQAVTYEHPVNAILVHDLIISVARGSVRTPDALRAWFDENRGRFPVRLSQ
jgi:hypothetical protein